jgi:putative ABC transport system substrate-binding protein
MLFSLGLLVVPLPIEAQPGKVWKIGFLGGTPGGARDDAFRLGLRELGYEDSRDIVIEYGSSAGKVESLPQLAADLVGLNVDVLVATANPAITTAQQATKTIPIVMLVPTDAVELGFVASLARPGGNITGLTTQTAEDLAAKRVQLLKEAASQVTRLAILWDPSEPSRQQTVKETERAAQQLGLRVQIVEARTPSDLDRAFATIRGGGAQAVCVVVSAMLFTQRARTAALALTNRLPTVSATPEEARAGSLLSFAPDYAALYRRAAYFVDKILKGAKPADLPVEQPTKFELVVNFKTAKALGLTIPPSLLLRADYVIK